jgi:DNA-binding HxlR family transcriptional regulator
LARPLSGAQATAADDETLAKDVLGQVAGRWSIGVLCVLADASGPIRFSRVLDGVKGITTKVLTQTLRAMERDGFATRKVFPQVPPRVEYELTDLGRQLIAHVDPLIAWANGRAEDFRIARRRFNAPSDD